MPRNLTGVKSSAWKGGRIKMKFGYFAVRVDGRYIYEHRYLMEKKIGRPLRSDEIVHHKDGNKTNKNPGNLELLAKREHDRLETIRRHREGDFPYTRNRPEVTEEMIEPLLRKNISFRAIGRLLKTSHGTISNRVRSSHHLGSYST